MPLTDLEDLADSDHGDGAQPGPNERASILIVDDLQEKLLTFRSVLEDLGQDLVCAHSGAQALREVLAREFAVILLDVNMPDIDGIETAALIRRYRRSAHTPIIFITAYADEMQTARGYSLGAVDYILSPVVPEMLRTKVQVFVDLYLLRRRISRQADERVALAAAEAARSVAEENNRRAQYLARATQQLCGSLDVDVAARRLIELVVPELADEAIVIFNEQVLPHIDPAHQVLRTTREEPVQYRRGATPPMLRGLISVGMLEELPPPLQQLFEGLAEGRIASGLNEGSEAMPTVQPQWLGEHLRACAALPLIAGERMLAVLVVGARESGDWSLLENLVERAAIAFENARLHSSLQVEIVERCAVEAKLQQASRRKDEFLAMLSHELRNPLAPIRNAVEVVRRLAPPDPKLRWANETMSRQVSHLTRLVDELLDVARISEGKITLHVQSVDMLAVIEHGVEIVRPYIEHRNHKLTLDLARGPVWLRGDFARLSQVIANLLNNAAKYTETGGDIRLSIAVENGQALITVRDNGIGIEPELLPNVFDLFEQGCRSLDRSQGGMGVGLTLVRRLVGLHGGRVEANSAGAGRGAEFCVWLPCVTEVQPEAVEEAVPREPDRPEPCRVLIVDDNADAAESVAMVLRLYGHEVQAVSDATQALACVEAFAPQAIVLDIGLPGLDGYGLARRLRAMPGTAGALLIALTGYGQREDIARAGEAGFDHHFVKPADPQALERCLMQASSWPRSADGAAALQLLGPTQR